jgi:hypothetical protein
MNPVAEIDKVLLSFLNDVFLRIAVASIVNISIIVLEMTCSLLEIFLKLIDKMPFLIMI